MVQLTLRDTTNKFESNMVVSHKPITYRQFCDLFERLIQTVNEEEERKDVVIQK